MSSGWGGAVGGKLAVQWEIMLVQLQCFECCGC